MKAVVLLFTLSQVALAVPVWQPESNATAVDGDQPCCQGKCTKPGEEKYWSLARGLFKKHCGECCMNPKEYKLYHFFEKNLTKSAVDNPCKSFGYSKYDSTVTHGFGPIKMTPDLYDLPEPGPTPPSPPPPPPTGHCSGNSYCCPDAKKCLIPTETSCKDGADACGKGEVCCPLTKICVVPREPCVSPCDSSSYCCPVTKHCAAPTKPGVFCRGSGSQPCAKDEACCPTTRMCVKLGATCKPPLQLAAPSPPIASTPRPAWTMPNTCSKPGDCGRAYQACCAGFAAKGFPCTCHLVDGTGKSGGNCGTCGTGYSACCAGFKAKGFPCTCDIQ